MPPRAGALAIALRSVCSAAASIGRVTPGAARIARRTPSRRDSCPPSSRPRPPLRQRRRRSSTVLGSSVLMATPKTRPKMETVPSSMPNTTSPMAAFSEARMRAGADMRLSVVANPGHPSGATVAEPMFHLRPPDSPGRGGRAPRCFHPPGRSVLGLIVAAGPVNGRGRSASPRPPPWLAPAGVCRHARRVRYATSPRRFPNSTRSGLRSIDSHKPPIRERESFV